MGQGTRGKVSKILYTHPEDKQIAVLPESKELHSAINAHLCQIKSLTTEVITLRDSCMLVIRGHLLSKSEQERERLACRRYNKDHFIHGKVTCKVRDVIVNRPSEVPITGDVQVLVDLGLVKSPIPEHVLDRLPLPKALHADVSGLSHLAQFLRSEDRT